MPWRNGPGFIQELMLLLGTAGVVAMGMLAKIAAEVRDGKRDKFLSAKLWLELPAILVMTLVATGINVWFGLDGWVGNAVAVVCGWSGPRAIDAMIGAIADRVRGGR